MSNQSIGESVRELLGCEEKTAESILMQCHQAGINDIIDVEKVEEDIYTVLELSTYNEVYYIFLGDGFFLEQIRQGAEAG